MKSNFNDEKEVININLNKKCEYCGSFFPVKLLSLKLFCDKKECEEHAIHRLNYIKQTRAIRMDYFDIYDLDRPIFYKETETSDYERVCRICGQPILDRKGEYNIYKNYCKKCVGSDLFSKFDWGFISKGYAGRLRDINQEFISEELEKRFGKNYLNENEDFNVTICEKCKKLCQIEYWNLGTRMKRLPVIEIHHKIPVHTLTWENLYLIWDDNNLIALCPECHHKQEHFLSKIKNVSCLNFKKITDFMNN